MPYGTGSAKRGRRGWMVWLTVAVAIAVGGYVAAVELSSAVVGGLGGRCEPNAVRVEERC